MDPKTRIDAWYAGLSDAQRWAAYDRLRGSRWYDFADWAAHEFALPDKPSRSAVYRFADAMRAGETARRIQQALAARAEARRMGECAGETADMVKMLQTLAQTLAVDGDAEKAQRYVGMAMAIADRARLDSELKLKQKAEERKGEELNIALEKLKIEQAKNAAASKTVQDDKLTPEEREAKLREIFGI